MSMGPLGMIGSAAGSQLPQLQGAEKERAQQETSNQARQTQSETSAELAAGVEQTEQHEQASDRDADGRRLWEQAPEPASRDEGDAAAEDQDAPRSRDPSGQTGTQLDLNG